MNKTEPELVAYIGKKPSLKSLYILTLMFLAAIFSSILSPKELMAEKQVKFNLETLVPKQFNSWKIDESLIPIIKSADLQSSLNKLYTQLLDRTYINDKGQRIMLTIAYGNNQGNDDFQVHRPEFCYISQGFWLNESLEDNINLGKGKLSVRRLEATKGRRIEPITYWITVGEKATLPGFGRKLAQLSYGLTGKIPDGMLVRVSSIMDDRQGAYKLHDEFIKELIQSIDKDDQIKIVDRKSTRLNSSHEIPSRMPSSA